MMHMYYIVHCTYINIHKYVGMLVCLVFQFQVCNILLVAGTLTHGLLFSFIYVDPKANLLIFQYNFKLDQLKMFKNKREMPQPCSRVYGVNGGVALADESH